MSIIEWNLTWVPSTTNYQTRISIVNVQGDPKGSERFLKSGCGSQMSQAMPTKFSMLFKHNYSKNF